MEVCDRNGPNEQEGIEALNLGILQKVSGTRGSLQESLLGSL